VGHVRLEDDGVTLLEAADDPRGVLGRVPSVRLPSGVRTRGARARGGAPDHR